MLPQISITASVFMMCNSELRAKFCSTYSGLCSRHWDSRSGVSNLDTLNLPGHVS